jgi:hypothetical protein
MAAARNLYLVFLLLAIIIAHMNVNFSVFIKHKFTYKFFMNIFFVRNYRQQRCESMRLCLFMWANVNFYFINYV